MATCLERTVPAEPLEYEHVEGNVGNFSNLLVASIPSWLVVLDVNLPDMS